MNKNRQLWVIGAAFVAAIAGGAIGVASTRGAAPPEVHTHSADVTVDTPTTLAVPDPTTSTSVAADTTTLAPLINTTGTTVALDQRVTNLEHEVDQITTPTTGIPVPSTTTTTPPQIETTTQPPATTNTTVAKVDCHEHPEYSGCQPTTTSTTAG